MKSKYNKILFLTERNPKASAEGVKKLLCHMYTFPEFLPQIYNIITLQQGPDFTMYWVTQLHDTLLFFMRKILRYASLISGPLVNYKEN